MVTRTQGTRDLFAPTADKTYTVSELAARARALLEERIGLVRVVGEVSDATVASSGHLYFTLKDSKAALPAVMFRASLGRLGGVAPPQGAQIECLGRLTLYEARGRTQLVVEWMQPRGAGVLSLKFLALKHKLEAEGLFASSRKRPLPWLPGQVGIVTSPTGAAIRDMLKVLERRFPVVPVLLCPVPVQGQGAAAEIARAIELMGDGAHCDVLIVGRGGGSAEDLWAFNEEAVVRAIVASVVPVISAVGHEVDVVLTDLAADVRAATPTAAAELVVPDRAELKRQLLESAADLQRQVLLAIERSRNRLFRAAARVRDPRLVLAASRIRLDEAVRLAEVALTRHLAQARERLTELRVRLATRDGRGLVALGRSRLQGAVGRLQVLSPLHVLARGYSITTGADGLVLRDAAAVRPQDQIRVRLQRGELDSVVLRIRK